MALVVESTSSTDFALATSVTITKPAGLAVGDLMVALLASGDTDIHSRTTLSGWTLLQSNGFFSSSRGIINAQYKIADAGDVAASDFTFSTSVAAAQSGTILRISGAPQSASAILGSETDTASNGTAVSFASSQTPLVTNSLAIVAHLGFGNAATGSITSYSSTPSLTFTEVSDHDYDYAGDSSVDMIFGVAYATTTSSEITAYGCTYSATKGPGAILIVVNPITNATGTNAVFQTSPVTFATLTGSTQGGTNALLQPQPAFLEQSGTATSPTQWTNETATTTEWTNET